MTSTKINQLQLVQQNVQNILLQKQQLQTQTTELDSALSGLESTEKAYHILGNIMVASSKEDLLKELKDKKEVIDLRIKNLIKQEEKLKTTIDELQKEVMEELKKDKKNE